MNFVAIDKTRILEGRRIEKCVYGPGCSMDVVKTDEFEIKGPFSEFKLHESRCVVIPDEYEILLNLEGCGTAYTWAKENGYIV